MEDTTPKEITRREMFNVDYTPLKEVVKNLTELLEEHPTAIVHVSYGEGYLEHEISWTDYETELEVQTRLAREANMANYRRQQYEALKKEFG